MMRLAAVLLLLPVPALSVWVLSSGRDVTAQKRGPGTVLLSPSIASYNEFIFCARSFSVAFVDKKERKKTHTDWSIELLRN